MSIPMAEPPDAPRPPVLDGAAALATLLVAVALLRLAPLRLTLAAARTVKCLAPRPADRDTAMRIVSARDWASRFLPGRAACLELSLAAFLAAGLRGRAVDWCIGCRFMPCASHAWVEADHQPVGEPDTPDRPYHVTIRI
ncbi:lasso peptide biosynthesis B2 protein [Streptomyces sp. CA-250714]|uniref:lasso peptide biosynthesis B2 protein n=1 Tax=Streptomyces sp. CA-250714 TaxID=3240060 RepID=UPI003D8A23A2